MRKQILVEFDYCFWAIEVNMVLELVVCLLSRVGARMWMALISFG